MAARHVVVLGDMAADTTEKAHMNGDTGAAMEQLDGIHRQPLQLKEVAGMRSESMADIKSEWVAGLGRNLQISNSWCFGVRFRPLNSVQQLVVSRGAGCTNCLNDF